MIVLPLISLLHILQTLDMLLHSSCVIKQNLNRTINDVNTLNASLLKSERETDYGLQ